MYFQDVIKQQSIFFLDQMKSQLAMQNLTFDKTESSNSISGSAQSTFVISKESKRKTFPGTSLRRARAAA